MDEISLEIECLARCIDDMCPWDDSLEEHWWRIIMILEIMGNAGIVLNPDKFQFALKSVNYAGFRVTPDSVEPLPKFIESIKLSYAAEYHRCLQLVCPRQPGC